VRFLTAEEEKRLRKVLRERDRKMRSAHDHHEAMFKAGKWSKPPGAPYPTAYVDHLEPLVLLLLNTGLRFGEATQLRHSDINLKDRLITVAGEGAKSGRTRVVPMNLEAHRILSSLKGTAGELLFHGDPGERLKSIKSSWKALRKEAAISGLRLHDLRHTFASRVKRGGADLYAVQRLLGHSSPIMTQRYAHLQPDDLRAAVEKVSG
jgi:integrase